MAPGKFLEWNAYFTEYANVQEMLNKMRPPPQNAWGQPSIFKTDNGPAYVGNKFTSFCLKMDVQLIHGLPYNPQGQGIVERAHRSLKEMLLKQKGELPCHNRHTVGLLWRCLL